MAHSSRQPRAHAPRGHDTYDDHEDAWQYNELIPHYVRYMDETPDTYLVYDLRAGTRHEVEKGRVTAAALSERSKRSFPGGSLLRASTVALLFALLGGVGALLIGIPVVVLVTMRRARLGRRLRRWRQRHQEHLLPVEAREEYDRLRSALWQGMLALALGALVIYLLLPHLAALAHQR
jgi:hypothetical protein